MGRHDGDNFVSHTTRLWQPCKSIWQLIVVIKDIVLEIVQLLYIHLIQPKIYKEIYPACKHLKEVIPTV